MEDQLKELLQFLHDKNPQVRQIALSNLLGHTPKGSPHRGIFFTGIGAAGNDCIRDLKLLCRDQLAIAHDAFRALINLSDDAVLNSSLSEPTFLAFLVSYILNPPSILADLASMLLSNITSQALTCVALISLKVAVIPQSSAIPPYYPPQSRSGTSPPPLSYPSGEATDVLALPLLVQAFVQGAQVDVTPEQKNRKGDLHFLASVFANISMVPAGRQFFLAPRPVDILVSGTGGELEYPLSQLVAFTEHTDTIRRGGVASTIKHCAFDVPAHKAILSPETELVSVPPYGVSAPGINALPYILLPLAGPEEFDLEDQEKLPAAVQLLPNTKKREVDEVLRLTHVETLLLVCTTRGGRDYLRNNGVYEVVRAMHLAEQDEKVSEQIERLVNLIKGDEAPLHELESDGWSHRTLDPNVDKASKDPAVEEDNHQTAPTGSLLGDDDEDDTIVEI
ncbi:hypothetical protein DFH11DRAFT_1701313 [Phellopilus nigrolimitatus]|nr:hypothetical protein DFH11DRAFT_1701313 [Phellopilus nigrolimitatus]